MYKLYLRDVLYAIRDNDYICTPDQGTVQLKDIGLSEYGNYIIEDITTEMYRVCVVCSLVPNKSLEKEGE